MRSFGLLKKEIFIVTLFFVIILFNPAHSSNSPDINVIFTPKSQYFYVTQFLTKKDGIGLLYINNEGTDDAKDIKITITSPEQYFSEKIISVSILQASKDANKDLNLYFSQSVLDATEDIQMSVKIEYYDNNGKKFETVDTFFIGIKDKNTMNFSNPQMISLYVAPKQSSVRQFAVRSTGGISAKNTEDQILIARWLFENIKSSGIDYTSDIHASEDYIQFPLETLKNKGGDCEDLAILYSSLLESVGIKSVIVLIPGHALSGFEDYDGKIIPVDVTVQNFDDALRVGESKFNENSANKTTIFPSEYGEFQPIVLPEKYQSERGTYHPIIIPMSFITKQASNCKISFNLNLGFYISKPVKFFNSGEAPGAGCSALETHDANDEKIGEDLRCWTVNPGGEKEVLYVADISFSDLFKGYSCRGV